MVHSEISTDTVQLPQTALDVDRQCKFLKFRKITNVYEFKKNGFLKFVKKSAIFAPFFIVLNAASICIRVVHSFMVNYCKFSAWVLA